jgi:hypothetical protein
VNFSGKGKSFAPINRDNSKRGYSLLKNTRRRRKYSMDSKTVIGKVRGLNSPTTLRRWTKMAENLAGVDFKRYRQNQYNYTDEDVIKLQEVADIKEAFGLVQAILQVFANERDPPMSINEKVHHLWNLINAIEGECTKLAKQLNNDNVRINQALYRLEERIARIEEQPKLKKLLTRNN